LLFASLTTLGQQLQPFQQQWQPLSSKQPGVHHPDSSQKRGGPINIGLLLQPAARQQQQSTDTQALTQLHALQQQPSQQQLAGSASAASTHHRKAKAKHHHPSKQDPQQQDSCLIEAAAPADAQQQPSQQQRKDQHGASGSPIAAFLAHAAQAKLLIAGAASAIVSRTAMAPLERVKMDLLLKTSSRSAMDTAVWVWQREGLAGFWKGNGLNLLRTAPFKVRAAGGHQGRWGVGRMGCKVEGASCCAASVCMDELFMYLTAVKACYQCAGLAAPPATPPAAVQQVGLSLVRLGAV
jgi:hypothetical protein